MYAAQNAALLALAGVASAQMVSQIFDGQPQAPSATYLVSPAGGTGTASAVGTPSPYVASGSPVESSITVTASSPSFGANAVTGPTSVAPVSQGTDGQIQASSAPVASYSVPSAAPEASSAAPVSQISDGQIQASGLATAAASGSPVLPSNGTLITSATPTPYSSATEVPTTATAGAGSQIQRAAANPLAWSVELAGAAGLAALLAVI